MFFFPGVGIKKKKRKEKNKIPNFDINVGVKCGAPDETRYLRIFSFSFFFSFNFLGSINTSPQSVIGLKFFYNVALLHLVRLLPRLRSCDDPTLGLTDGHSETFVRPSAVVRVGQQVVVEVVEEAEEEGSARLSQSATLVLSPGLRRRDVALTVVVVVVVCVQSALTPDGRDRPRFHSSPTQVRTDPNLVRLGSRLV